MEGDGAGAAAAEAREDRAEKMQKKEPEPEPAEYSDEDRARSDAIKADAKTRDRHSAVSKNHSVAAARLEVPKSGKVRHPVSCCGCSNAQYCDVMRLGDNILVTHLTKYNDFDVTRLCLTYAHFVAFS